MFSFLSLLPSTSQRIQFALIPPSPHTSCPDSNVRVQNTLEKGKPMSKPTVQSEETKQADLGMAGLLQKLMMIKTQCDFYAKRSKWEVRQHGRTDGCKDKTGQRTNIMTEIENTVRWWSTPLVQRQRQAGLCEFKANLVDKVSSRTTRTTHKQQQQKGKKRNSECL